MIVSIQPSSISGRVRAVASKSATQRAYAAALVRRGESFIHHPGNSSDEQSALGVIRSLGAEAGVSGNTVRVQSNGIRPRDHTIHCGESGLCARMFTAIAALAADELVITGTGTLSARPMNFFEQTLPQLGVQVHSDQGRLPLRVKGPLEPKHIEVDGSLSSQYLTGLLFAYAAAKASGVTIKVTGLNSRPYIDLTLEVMQAFGLHMPAHPDYETFHFGSPGLLPDTGPVHYTVEGDWSGASMLLVAGAVAGEVQVSGLRIDSVQADRRITTALRDAGAVYAESNNGTVTVKRGSLRPFEFDATQCPDLFPPLVALAANCPGPSRISGVHRLGHKESNRFLTLREEFARLGTAIEREDDVMIIHGMGRPSVQQPVLDSHHDHRIAMACAVAALNADQPVAIRNADSVKKSYPGFWDHLVQLNAGLSLKPFTTGNTFTL